MSRRSRLLKIGLGFVLILVSIFTIIIFVKGDSNSVLLERQKPESLSANWHLKATGESITLPTTVKAGEMEPVTIVGKIPSTDYRNTTILFRSSQQQVRIILDGKELYSYGEVASHPFIKTPPSTWNLISVPYGSEGAVIEVTVMSYYHNFAGTLNEMFIGNYTQCIDYIRTEQMIFFAISLSIVFVGMVLCVTYCSYERKHAATHQLLYLGLLIFCIGLWMLSESKMEQFYLSNPYIMWAVSPITLLLMPIPLVARVKERLLTRKGRILADSLMGLSILATLVGIMLQLLGIYDLMEYLWVIHIILVLSALFAFGMSIKHFRTNMGIAWKFVGVMFGGTLLIELTLFYMGRYDQIGETISMTALIASVVLGGVELHKIIVKAQQNELLQEKLNNQRLLMITSQIKPHFVYNTLGAIYGQIKSEPDVAEKLIYNFSKYLRTNMDAVTNDSLVLFSQEVQHIQTYVAIEEIRFNGNVHVELEIRCGDFSLPPLTIQPLVENAIKHGICQKEEGGTVWLQAKENRDSYIITVTDDGVGFDAQGVADGVGLESVRTRLEAISHATFSIESTLSKGTTATITFPKKEAGA